MPHRSFAIPDPKPTTDSPPEPITFEIIGQTFTCTPEIPLGTTMGMIRAANELSRLPEDERGARNAIAWEDFILGVLVLDDRPRWQALLSRPDFTQANIKVLIDVYMWLQETYSNLVAPSRNGSSDGSVSTLPTSSESASESTSTSQN